MAGFQETFAPNLGVGYLTKPSESVVNSKRNAFLRTKIYAFGICLRIILHGIIVLTAVFCYLSSKLLVNLSPAFLFFFFFFVFVSFYFRLGNRIMPSRCSDPLFELL